MSNAPEGMGEYDPTGLSVSHRARHGGDAGEGGQPWSRSRLAMARRGGDAGEVTQHLVESATGARPGSTSWWWRR
jgi:hypothetical protein